MENLLLVQITLQIRETMSEARKKHTRCFDAYASYELFLTSSRACLKFHEIAYNTTK